MFNITFKTESGGNLTVPAASKDNIMALAVKAGIELDAPCSGNGTCGKCRIRVLEGAVASEPNGRLPETSLLNGWRLACQSEVVGDAVVFVPDASSAYKDGIQTADLGSDRELRLYETAIREIFDSGFKPGSRLSTVSVKLEPPTLDDKTPDNERLILAVMELAGIKDTGKKVYMSNNALGMLPKTLRDSGFHVKCLLRVETDYAAIMDVRPDSDGAPLCGLAVDIGTTTVSAALLDLESGGILAKLSRGNGQIRYGADVISRIIQADKPDGLPKLCRAIREETLYPMITRMCEHAGIDPMRVCRTVIAANTTMNHLFAGVPASSIREEPYVPVFRELPGLAAYEFGLPIHPEGRVIFAPNVGSYVGGDITAGALASMIWRKDEPTLFIDLGTNGEIVFGNSEFLLCCACSAGPAFEGGDITCGMRAAKGAIESCTIDGETMEPTLGIIGTPGTVPAGICGSGLIDTVSELFRRGIINSRGRFIRDGDRIRRDEYGASYVLAFGGGGMGDILINEVDIDNFIRTKAAIFSAIRAMLDAVGMDASDIGSAVIAGGIGSGIDIENAISIGMLPAISPERYTYAGNSSLTGACAMLLSDGARWEVHKLGRSMTYLELSTHPGYMDEFVAACFLPHTDATLFERS